MINIIGGRLGLSAAAADVMIARAMSERRMSRRELFTFWRKEPKKEPARAPDPDPWPRDRVTGPSFGRKLPLRPPGTMQEYILREACTRCGKCVEACPADAIFPL